MSVFYPVFYPAFRCRAAACRHSCCRGWEIDVDEASAARYREERGELGEALRAALFRDGEGWHFRLTREGRCPFLQTDGLCRLIRELGEDALCDICALHPRFFLELGEHEIWGLGMSCEAAAELLLREDRLRFLCGETGELLDFPGLLRRLGLAFPERLLHRRAAVDEDRRRELLRRFRDTEPIDARWPEELRALEDGPLPGPEDGGRGRLLYEYILLRQLERLDELGAQALADYAALCADLIALWDAASPDTAGHLRRISEQIEYSTENVDRLIRR